MSAFMFFSNASRAQIKEENPGIAFGAIATKVRKPAQCTNTSFQT